MGGLLKKISTKLSLKFKLLASNCLLLFLTLGIGGFCYKSVNFLSVEVYKLSSAGASSDWLAQSMATKPELLQYVWRGVTAYEENTPATESQIKDINDTMNKMDEMLQKYFVESPLNQQEKAVYENLMATWIDNKKTLKQITIFLQEGKQPRKEVISAADSLTDQSLSLSDAISELSGIVKQKGSEAANTGRLIASNVKFLGIFMCIFIVVIGFLVFYFATSLSSWLTEFAHQLAKGAQTLKQDSKVIAVGSSQIAHRTYENAASLQEIAATIEEVSIIVIKSSENAQNSKTVSDESEECAEKGKGTVNQVFQAITDIHSANGQLIMEIDKGYQEIRGIVKVIEDIGQKTKVINDIVFQTKLLSFNASVEAARAGEYGKSFAVVAEEVGKLAQMSGHASKEITDILMSSMGKVESIIGETSSRAKKISDIGKTKVDSALQITNKCTEALNEIVSNAKHVRNLVSEIATACSEQAHGVTQIKEAILQLDKITQGNAADSQKFVEGSEGLSSQAIILAEMSSSLLNTVKGIKTTMK